jgi:hypothetical protein
MNTSIAAIFIFGFLALIIICGIAAVVIFAIDRKRIQSGEFMPDISDPNDRDNILLAQSMNFTISEDAKVISEAEDEIAFAANPSNSFDLFADVPAIAETVETPTEDATEMDTEEK